MTEWTDGLFRQHKQNLDQKILQDINKPIQLFGLGALRNFLETHRPPHVTHRNETCFDPRPHERYVIFAWSLTTAAVRAKFSQKVH